MAAYVTSFGNHNLRTNSIEEVAKDISKRLNLTIEYGYELYDKHAELLEMSPSRNNRLILGTFYADNQDGLKYTILDKNYSHKLLFEKYGYNFLQKKCFWKDLFYVFNSTNINQEIEIDQLQIQKKRISQVEYSLNIDDYDDIIIYKDYYINNETIYEPKWRSLCRTFVEEGKGSWFDSSYSYEENEFLQSFRQENLYWSTLLGGNKVYYCNDECERLKGMSILYKNEHLFEEIEQVLNKEYNHLLLSVSKYRLNKSYKEQYVQSKNFPLSFLDDFKDLS